MSIRSQVMAALVIRLKTITTGNGYAVSIGSKVFQWRKFPVTKNDTPCLLVFDGKVEREYVTDEFGSQVGMVRNRLEVQIEGWSTAAVTDAEARNLEADIAACVHANETLDGLVDKIEIPESEIALEQYESVTGAVRLVLHIIYNSDRNVI